jgi:hypothetical protein
VSLVGGGWESAEIPADISFQPDSNRFSDAFEPGRMSVWDIDNDKCRSGHRSHPTEEAMSTTIQHSTGHTARHHHISHTGIVWMLAALAVVGILVATVSIGTGDSPTRIDPLVNAGPNVGLAPDVVNNRPAAVVLNAGPNADLAPDLVGRQG